MSTKGRTKFTVSGIHPLLYILRDRLIHQGFALVPWDGEELPDFVLFGAELEKPGQLDSALLALTGWSPVIEAHQIPVFLLSSSDVYGDRTRDMEPATKVAMAEHHACMVSSTLEPAVGSIAFSLLSEWMLTRQTRTMVLRTFNVYGPDIQFGVIHEWLMAARRGEALNIYGNGYQTRTYLHQDDFYTCFDKLIKRFLKGARGIYNVGHDQEISLKRLADSIWQLTRGTEVVMLSEQTCQDRYSAQWKLPDLTRIKAFAGWKPRTSLRTGLFLMVDPHRR